MLASASLVTLVASAYPAYWATHVSRSSPIVASLDTAAQRVKKSAASFGFDEQWADTWIEQTLCGHRPDKSTIPDVSSELKEAMSAFVQTRPSTQEIQRFWGFRAQNKVKASSDFGQAVKQLTKVGASDWLASTLCGHPDDSSIPECYFDDEDESGLKCVELDAAMSNLLKTEPSTEELQRFWSKVSA